MFRTLIIFMPVAACVFWMIAHALTSYRQRTFPIMMVLMFFTGLLLFNDSCYSDARSPMDLVMASNIIAQLAGPCLIPMVGLYLRRLRTSERPNPLLMTWLVVPAAMFAAEIVMHLLAQPGEIHSFLEKLYSDDVDIDSYKGTIAYAHYISSVVVYRAVIAVEMLALLIFQIIDAINSKSKFRHIISFWRGGAIRLKGLQTFNLTLVFILFVIKLLLFRSYINNHPWTMALMALMMSISISLFCYASAFAPCRNVKLSDMFKGWRFNYRPEEKETRIAEMVDELIHDAGDTTVAGLRAKLGYPEPDQDSAGVVEVIPPAPAFTSNLVDMSGDYAPDSLHARFRDLMLEEMLFLSPQLTLGEVARRLHSNTTYVSKLVNDSYHMGFPELINTLRVDYAQRYMLDNPQAIQSQIASECGFLSAPAFNNTFRRIVGATPKAWLAAQRNEEK